MRPVILDVDTGLDDAMALLLAARHPGLDLLAVTCVEGNARVDDVVHNTLTVLHAAGRDDVPVARGADRPLVEPAEAPRLAHGVDGMGDLGCPAPPTRRDPRPAVELLRYTLVEAARVARPVTLVTLAPLTNVALLLRTCPEAAVGLREVVVMGGSFDGAGGGDSPDTTTEFNVRHDPEAAAEVLGFAYEQGVPVTMYGLDVFFAPTVSQDQARRLSAPGRGPATGLAGRLAAVQCARSGTGHATIGDAGAVCAVIDPGGLVAEDARVQVALTGILGLTTVVPAGSSAPAPTVRVVTHVDGPRYAALWLDTVG